MPTSAPMASCTPGLLARVASLLRHCEASGADGIVFSGSTFGPAVEEGRKGIAVPVLRIEEGDDGRGGRARRLDPRGVDPEARDAGGARHARRRRPKPPASRPRSRKSGSTGARDALNAGDIDKHDRLIAEQSAAAGDFDTVVLSMISMAPARAKMPPALASKTLTSGETAVTRMRKLLGE